MTGVAQIPVVAGGVTYQITGANLTNYFTGSYGNTNVVANLAALGTNPISTTGNITGGNLDAVNLVINNIRSDDSSFVNIEDGVNITGAVVASGNITSNYFIGNGSQLTGISAGANTGNVTFSGEIVIGTGTSNLISGLYLAPSSSSANANMYLRVRGNITDEPTHIHFDTGNNTYYNQFIGDDNKYIQLANTGNIIINSNDGGGNSAQWIFAAADKITLPNGASLNDTSGDSVAFGQNAGLTSQAQHAVAIGINAGSLYQGEDSIAIGYNAGYRDQQRGVAIGWNAGQGGTVTKSVSDAQGGSGPVHNYVSGDGNPTLTLDSVVNVNVNDKVFGNNIPSGAFVASINDPAINISAPPTAALTAGDDITFVSLTLGLNNATNVVVGMRATGTDIPANTFVQNTGCSVVEFNQYPTAPLIDNASIVFSVGQGFGATAVGYQAGSTFQGDDAVAVGRQAGYSSQNDKTVAVGGYAGYNVQGANAVAVGYNAGQGTQGINAVAVGYNAGYSTQGAGAVAIGEDAGFQVQGEGAVAIGFDAGGNAQGILSVAIGTLAGNNSQGNAAVAVGYNAGITAQGIGAVAIGTGAGRTSQGENAVAIGDAAGYEAQGANSIAIGTLAGESATGNNSIIINATGNTLNQTTANTFTVAPVRNDVANTANVMFYNATSKEITYGNTINVAGNITGGNLSAVNLVINSIRSDDSSFVNIEDGVNITGAVVASDNITGGNILTGGLISATGNISGGNISTGIIRLTNGADIKDTANNAVAFGKQAGATSQGSHAVAIGRGAGLQGQGGYSVAVGYLAGNNTQGGDSVAVGVNSGGQLQGAEAVAVGSYAGYTSQGNLSVAVGRGAGENSQGANSVAVGTLAGRTNQANNSIILNATGANLEQTTANTFTVAPVRNDVANIGNVMFYNATSKEITYGNVVSVAGNITSGNILTGGLISATGNITGGNLSVTNITGSLTTASQANITTVGTLGNLGVSGQANITQQVNTARVSATGNITGGNLAITGNTATITTANYSVGYLEIPQISLAANATAALVDSGKHYYSVSASNLALTIANNTSVVWPVGTALSIVNRGTANIIIAGDTGVSLYLAGNSTAGNRVVTTYGMATVMNVAANVWMINGTVV